METRTVLQDYVNNFRRRISRVLKPGIGLSAKVYPAQQGGAVIQFSFEPSGSNDDDFEPVSQSVNEILKAVPQNLVGGNIDAVKFKGTNISMEPKRILIIKGEDDLSEWDDEAARRDFERIIHAQAPKAVS
jgi:hypothetical protein